MKWGVSEYSHEGLGAAVTSVSKAALLACGIATLAMTGATAQTAPRVTLSGDEVGLGSASAEELRASASEAGSIRIIVGLDMDFRPEGLLSESEETSQRASIASGQQQVLSRLASPRNVVSFASIPYISMVVSPADLDRILSMQGITSVQEDIALSPFLSDSTGLVDAPPLWRQGAAGAGTSVAVLDTGTRPNHAAFGNNKIVASACFSSNIPDMSTFSLCPNGQEVQINRNGARAGRDCDTSVVGCGHGTHVADIAAGSMRGNIGMAREADIISLQVFSQRNDAGACSSQGGAPCVTAFTTDIIQGLEQVNQWRNRFNIASANMSLGGGGSIGPCDTAAPAMTAIIDTLRSRGVATTVASGNNGFNNAVSFPSCISSAITVGSTTKSDGVSFFSNHAAMINLMAPGDSIVAADADGSRRATTNKSGTSMAAPHVAGAFAMLKSHNPDASVDEIERALVCSGETVSEVNTPKPRISMRAARSYLDNPDTENGWGFGRPQSVNRWTHVLGNWFHDGNAMRVNGTPPNTGWNIAQAPFCADNIRVNARMERTNPDEFDAWATGLAISGETDANGNFSGLFFLYYPFQSSLSASIFELDRFNPFTGTGTVNDLCSNFDVLPGVDPQGLLRLRAIKRGNDLRFLINGTEVCDGVTNSRFSNGHLSTVMFAPQGAPGHSLRVARVQAQALAGSKGWQGTNSTTASQVSLGGIASAPFEGSFSRVAAARN